MTAYVTEKNNDDAEREHDAALLRLSNYIYNNRSGAIQSPSYAAILKAIKKIDPDDKFLKITGKFRGIAASGSAALSDVSSDIKNRLRNLMNDTKYGPEIEKDRKPITSPKKSASNNFEKYEKPPSAQDIRRSPDTDHTSEESFDGNTGASLEMENIFQANKKINLQDVFNPSKDNQHRAIQLLIRYVQAYNATPVEKRSQKSPEIISLVKCLCPGMLSKITPNIESDFIDKLQKSDVDNLYDIAGANARELKAFDDHISSAVQRDSGSLNLGTTKIKELANYLNYVLFTPFVDQSEVANFKQQAKWVMQAVQTISPKLRQVITDKNYRHKIDGVIATLCSEEKTQLLTLSSKNGEALRKTKDILSRQSSSTTERYSEGPQKK